MRKTNDTTRTTYTGRARSLAGGWFGPRPWPRSEDNAAKLAAAIGLRLASGTTATQSTDRRAYIGASALLIPSRGVRAAITDAERDTAADLAAGYAMLCGASTARSVHQFNGGRSEHGFGVTLATVPSTANAYALTACYHIDTDCLEARHDMRAWQQAHANRARAALAAQWIAEAREADRAPLDRARRVRAAVRASIDTARELITDAIGTDELAERLAGYGAACIDADDADGARAFAEFAQDAQRDAEERRREWAESREQTGEESADAIEDLQRAAAVDRVMDSAAAEADASDAADAAEAPETSARMAEPMNDPRAKKSGTSDADAARAIDAAADAATGANEQSTTPSTGAEPVAQPMPGGGWALVHDGIRTTTTLSIRNRAGGTR